jgi:SAM-dependent methyltransferase
MGLALNERDRALVALGRELRARGYRFVTPTPSTHARVLERRADARDLRDVFGWNRRFTDLEAGLFELLRAADAVVADGAAFRATVRFSTLGELLLAHSGFPTTASDAVFFGPDTYRFAALVERSLSTRKATRVAEIGCGTGAASIVARRYAPEVIASDINQRALHFTAVNAELAHFDLEIAESDLLANVAGDLDVVIANPPYLVDDDRRLYRHGGSHGIELSVRIVNQALERAKTLVLYTATPIVDGVDPLFEALAPSLAGRLYEYGELDPDVFGEELDRPPYRAVERIAVVSLVASR